MVKRKGCERAVSSQEIMRTTRDIRPSHYILKVQSYSLFVATDVERYESAVFESGGYNWRLVFYPKGKKKNSEYISMYIQIANTEGFSASWEINVQFKLFIHDQIQDKYLVMEGNSNSICKNQDLRKDGFVIILNERVNAKISQNFDATVDIRRFSAMKTEWGFEEFLSLTIFNDAANGYLVDDCCFFGAEIFVLQSTHKGESLSMVKSPANDTFTWKINNFSQMKENRYDSDMFTVGYSKWNLTIYPKGKREGKGNSLSVYLYRNDVEKLSAASPCPKVYAAFTLRLKNHLQKTDYEVRAGHWFGTTEGLGLSKFISLDKLTSTSNKYIRDDCIILECQITQLSLVENFKY